MRFTGFRERFDEDDRSADDEFRYRDDRLDDRNSERDVDFRDSRRPHDDVDDDEWGADRGDDDWDGGQDDDDWDDSDGRQDDEVDDEEQDRPGRLSRKRNRPEDVDDYETDPEKRQKVVKWVKRTGVLTGGVLLGNYLHDALYFGDKPIHYIDITRGIDAFDTPVQIGKNLLGFIL
jgi:hypothetical protein